MIAFPCSGCGQALQVNDGLAGKAVKCPRCQALVPADAAGVVPAPARPAESSSSWFNTLPPDPPQPGATESGQGQLSEGPTQAGNGPEREGGFAFQPGQPHPEPWNFLGPPQQSGELGRLGPYRVLQVLGVGGMGVVFRAEDPLLQRLVALKAMLPVLAASDSARQRFLREARVAAAIEHDHIVHIYQVGEDRGVPYLAMQLLQGESLDKRIEREPILAVGEVLRIGREIASGLAAAHKRDLLHRDIKPANIWLEAETARVKIVDFGLARPANQESHLSQEGAIVGTPAFMAPEQAMSKTLDPRCDLFSLGCVLYRLCTGQLPFEGADTISTLMAVANHHPKPVHELNSQIPAALSELVARLLAKQPDERPATAGAVAEALAAIETNRTVVLEGQRLSVPAAVGQPRRRWAGVGVVIAGLLAALGVTAGILWNNRGSGTGTSNDKDSTVVAKKDSSKLPPKLQPKPLPKPRPEPPPGGKVVFRNALVPMPHPIPGVKRWTIQTRGHRGLVSALAYSPDGRWLASAGADGRIRLWDAAGNDLIMILPAHRGGVRALAWLPDQERLVLASVGNDNAVRVWEAKTGRLLYLRGMPRPGITDVAWLDGNTVAFRPNIRVVRIWHPASGQRLGALHGPPWESISLVAWSPDGKRLATAAQKIVQIWDGVSGNFLHECAGHNGLVHALAWSADSKFLATTSADRTVRVWPADSVLEKQVLAGHTDETWAVAWSPDGKTLASSGRDETVRLWDLTAKPPGEKAGLPKRIGKVHVLAWSSDGKTLAGADDTGRVRFWQAPWGKPIRKLPWCDPAEMAALAWSPDGTKLATLRRGGLLRLWDTHSGQLLCNIPGSDSHGVLFSWSPDSKKLAVKHGQWLEIHDAQSGQTLCKLEGHTKHVLAAAWSPDGKRVASSGTFKSMALLIHDSATGKLQRTLKQAHWASALAWSPDGKVLASNGGAALQKDGGNLVVLWEVDTDNPPRTLPGHQHRQGPANQVLALAWSPSGKVLASGATDTTIRLWLADGKPLAVLRGHTRGVHTLHWLSDKMLTSLGRDNTGCIWDVDKDKPVRTLMGVPLWGRFGPDGRTLAAPDGPNLVRFWDLGKGQPRGALLMLRGGHPDLYLAISVNGHFDGTRPARWIQNEIVYMVRTGKHWTMLTPVDFGKMYHWKNKPQSVHLYKSGK